MACGQDGDVGVVFLLLLFLDMIDFLLLLSKEKVWVDAAATRLVGVCVCVGDEICNV